MKKLKFYSLYAFLLIGISQKMISQGSETNQLPNFQPVAPNAFEFLKYGEIPVGHYTGVPNITIPIYNINAKDLSLPISLSYHAGGFKVSEESGETGLGWTLNVGGTITQVVKGFDDFGPYNSRDNEFEAMYNELHNGPNLDIENCVPQLSWKIQNNHPGNASPTGISYYYYNAYNMAGIKDLEPDLFKFNFLGYSGDIVLDWKTESFKCLNNPNIKVIRGSSYGFEIKVPEGHTLFFNKVEDTKIEYTDNAYQEHINLIGKTTSRHYKLGHIITNIGETITFNYDTVNDKVHNLPSMSEIKIDPRRDYTCTGDNSTSAPGCNGNDSGTQFIQNETRTSQSTSYYLKEILFTNGKIEFENSLSRIDINNTMRLDKINILSNDKLINSYQFDYDYFIGDYVPSRTLTNGHVVYDEWNNFYDDLSQSETELTHRLKLKSVKELSKPAHNFTYYDENKFAKKTAKSNLWGFCKNGYNLKAGVLKTITYPTGGNTEFEYESHKYNGYEVSVGGGGGTTRENFNVYSSSGSQGTTIYNTDGNRMEYYGDMTAWEVGPCADYDDFTNINATVKKWKRDMNYPNWGVPDELISETRIVTGYYNQEMSTNFSGELKPDEMLTVAVSMNLEEGCQTSSMLPHCFADLNITSTILSNSDSTVVRYRSYPAGLRIKSISSIPSTGDVNSSTKKEYTYYEGKSMSPLTREIDELKNSYCIKPNTDFSGNTVYIDVNCSYMQKTTYDTSYYPISTSASGKHIGYDKVVETIYSYNKQKTLGKIIREYINNPDQGVTTVENPNQIYYSKLFPLQKSYPENGSLLSEKVYKKNNDLVSKSNFTYITFDKFCTYGRKSFYHSSYTSAIIGGYPLEAKVYAVGFYPIKSKNTLLSSKTQKSYFSNDSISISENYFYDSSQQIKKSTQTSNSGELITTDYKYPYNYYVQFPYNRMTSNNFITPVINKETSKKINEEIIKLSEQKTVYNDFGGNYLPQRVQTSKASQPLEDRIVYHNYDNKGNPTEVSKKEGSKIYYVWGYNQTQPIAKIEGYTDTQLTAVQAKINTAITASNNDSTNATEDALRTALKAIRDDSNMSEALVTSFTYDPLIGVTSITDPRGQTIYYKYDEFNRLKHVKDNEGNILSKNEYNYKN